MDLSDIEISFIYGETPEAEREEIVRNIRTILSTPVGTCPLYRDFGVDVSPVDYPIDVAQSMIAVGIIEAVARYEPRVRVTEVNFEPDIGGQLKVKAVVEIE